MEMVNDNEKCQHEQQQQQQEQIMKNPQQGVEGFVGIKEEEKGMIFHVLAVDDSRIERKILEQLLTISSYQVTSVESGDKALEFLGLLNTSSAPSGQEQGDRMRVNLIMTDYSMPGMTGYDLLKRLKESSLKDVPVILMSSENVPSRIHMCLEEGAEEFLLKPVRMSDLKKLQDYVARSLIQQRCCDDEDGDTKARICLIKGNLVHCDENKDQGSIQESDGNFGETEEETHLEKRSSNNKVIVGI